MITNVSKRIDFLLFNKCRRSVERERKYLKCVFFQRFSVFDEQIIKTENVSIDYKRLNVNDQRNRRDLQIFRGLIFFAGAGV